MPDNHIIRVLDEKPFSSLGDSDIASAESHIATCDQCKFAYDAARVAASMIQARTSETVDPGPFFKTRVMAAIRERHLTPEEPALVRMWRAAGALISTMALLLVTLTGMTIFSQSPDSQSQTPVVAASFDVSPGDVKAVASLFTMIEFLYIVLFIWIGVAKLTSFNPGTAGIERGDGSIGGGERWVVVAEHVE
jgi:hypothetical protein